MGTKREKEIMKYFMGIDNGGTTTKAAIFSQQGEEIGIASVSSEALNVKPGFAERDMEEMWKLNCQVIRQVLKDTGIEAAEISGIGVCGHGKGLYLWGKDGKPARYGIMSTDNRAYEYSEKWKQDGTEQKAFEISCQHVMACQPVSLLAWVKDHEPAVYANIQWVFECKDYVRFRLTGKPMAEITDYSGANLLDLHTKTYSDKLLELFGIPEMKDALPPLCKSYEICGTVSAQAAKECGILEGTPVIGGMFDIDACALACGVITSQQICMIAGTWSINEYLRKDPIVDGSILMNSLSYLPEYYLIEESSSTSVGNNEWVINQLLPEVRKEAKEKGTSIYDIINEWVDSISPYEFVPVFLPFIIGTNVHPNAKGSFIGISANHTRKHLMRSVYEGIVFSHRYHANKLLCNKEEKTECIRLAGGAARSEVWTQMFADVMQLPVETLKVQETGALGCAIAAAVGTETYASLEEAVGEMCHFGARVNPNPEYAKVYEKKYALYRKAIDCTDGLWTPMQELVEAY